MAGNNHTEIMQNCDCDNVPEITEENSVENEPTFCCDNCSEQFPEDDKVYCQGDSLCESCSNDHTGFCEECEETFYADNLESINEIVMCDSCVRRHTLECENCGDRFHPNRADHYSGNRGDYCCQDCFSENEGYCDDCGDIFDNDDLHYNDNGQFCNYCNRQSAYNDAELSNYYTDEKDVFDTKGFTVGFEIECNNNNHTPLTEELREYFDAKEDGSLGDNGIEYVSIPSNNNNTKELIFKIGKFLKENGFDVDKKCGFHVHFGGDLIKNQSVNRHKIMVAHNIFKDCLFNMLSPSRKNSSWCNGSIPLNAVVFTEYAINNPEGLFGAYSGRYSSLNYHSYDRHNTLENRMHQGTINPVKIFNWISTLINLYSFAVNSELNDLVRLRGNEVEFKRYILRDKDLINYYEERSKKFAHKAIRKRRSVFHGIARSVSEFKPDVEFKENGELIVKFKWVLGSRYIYSKELIPIFHKEFTKNAGKVTMEI